MAALPAVTPAGELPTALRLGLAVPGASPAAGSSAPIAAASAPCQSAAAVLMNSKGEAHPDNWRRCAELPRAANKWFAIKLLQRGSKVYAACLAAQVVLLHCLEHFSR
mmetsp:Transcript_12458/g.23927  ORF Transcript_12458/g.23927 Transcript_12458/m.23927 type:complete len:108 (+) Transcript_12458:3924-4247(+)